MSNLSYFSVVVSRSVCSSCVCFLFQAEDGIRDLVRSRGLGDVYKRQTPWERIVAATPGAMETGRLVDVDGDGRLDVLPNLSLIHI